MVEDRATYTAGDLAVIIPTKDRPQKVVALLESICRQTVPCPRIIIVASGSSIAGVIRSFSGRIPVEYHEIDPPGQIRQRNFGLRLLEGVTKLVGSLDDDIVLFPDALEKMIDFWNQVEPETAGIGFNVVNEPRHKPSRLKLELGVTTQEPGRVHRSGFHTSIGSVDDKIRTEWLNGGATIWRRAILDGKPNPEIDVPWAICEDLIFSYPIGKRYPLYVCPDARVQHEHVVDQFKSGNVFRQRGRTMALWRLYFVLLNEDLSVLSCLWATIVTCVASIVQGILVHTKRNKFHEGWGILFGMGAGIRRLVTGGDFKDLLARQ